MKLHDAVYCLWCIVEREVQEIDKSVMTMKKRNRNIKIEEL